MNTTLALHSFRKPYFDPDVFSLDAEARSVLVGKRGRAFALSDERADSGATLFAFLDGLRSPGGASWSILRELPEDAPLLSVVRSLDEAGLFSEDTVDQAAADANAAAELAHARQKLTAWLSQWLQADTLRARDILQGVRALALEAILRRRAAELQAPVEAATNLDREWGTSSDFFQRILRYQLRSWERGSPLALSCLLLSLDDCLGSEGHAAERVALDWARACIAERGAEAYSIPDLHAYLSSAAYFAASIGTPNARRRCSDVSTAESSSTGLNLMVHAEHLARDWQEGLGDGRFQAKLASEASLSLARGTYVEQYHLTRRFVEFLAPMFAQRLREPLRGFLFRHFHEEFGHEGFELDSCVALGLAADAVTASVPLPYSVAYIDLFMHIGEVDPVGWLVSILVTEGLPGSHTPVNESFKRQGLLKQETYGSIAQHEELNGALDHTLLPRHFMAQVGSVSPARQRIALDHLSFLLEFNFRLLESVETFYSHSDYDGLHEFLAVKHDQISSRLGL